MYIYLISLINEMFLFKGKKESVYIYTYICCKKLSTSRKLKEFTWQNKLNMQLM